VWPEEPERWTLAVRYKLSFTTGGLLASEAGIAARIHEQCGGWDQTRDQIRKQNPFGIRTASSVTRVTQELVDRLRTLRPDEIELVANGSATERNAIAWLAATRRYLLIAEFAAEVLRERYVRMMPTLDASHFDSFLAEKAAWAPEVADLAASTRTRLRQSLFQMLREADLLSRDGTIEPMFFSDILLAVLRAQGADAFQVFPMTDEQIARAMR
jgi:hypothetical protein